MPYSERDVLQLGYLLMYHLDFPRELCKRILIESRVIRPKTEAEACIYLEARLGKLYSHQALLRNPHLSPLKIIYEPASWPYVFDYPIVNVDFKTYEENSDISIGTAITIAKKLSKYASIGNAITLRSPANYYGNLDISNPWVPVFGSSYCNHGGDEDCNNSCYYRTIYRYLEFLIVVNMCSAECGHEEMYIESTERLLTIYRKDKIEDCKDIMRDLFMDSIHVLSRILSNEKIFHSFMKLFVIFYTTDDEEYVIDNIRTYNSDTVTDYNSNLLLAMVEIEEEYRKKPMKTELIIELLRYIKGTYMDDSFSFSFLERIQRILRTGDYLSDNYWLVDILGSDLIDEDCDKITLVKTGFDNGTWIHLAKHCISAGKGHIIFKLLPSELKQEWVDVLLILAFMYNQEFFQILTKGMTLSVFSLDYLAKRRYKNKNFIWKIIGNHAMLSCTESAEYTRLSEYIFPRIIERDKSLVTFIHLYLHPRLIMSLLDRGMPKIHASKFIPKYKNYSAKLGYWVFNRHINWLIRLLVDYEYNVSGVDIGHILNNHYKNFIDNQYENTCEEEFSSVLGAQEYLLEEEVMILFDRGAKMDSKYIPEIYPLIHRIFPYPDDSQVLIHRDIMSLLHRKYIINGGDRDKMVNKELLKKSGKVLKNQPIRKDYSEILFYYLLSIGTSKDKFTSCYDYGSIDIHRERKNNFYHLCKYYIMRRFGINIPRFDTVWSQLEPEERYVVRRKYLRVRDCFSH